MTQDSQSVASGDGDAHFDERDEAGNGRSSAPLASSDQRHDLPLLVIGGSAGAQQPLLELLAGIRNPQSITVAVVLHQPHGGLTRLPDFLASRTGFQASYAADGEELQPGRIAIAPPDQHLVIADGHVGLTNGPHENNWRPAVDVLFRSAAIHRRTRAAGVILSGWMDDGAAGARAIASCGGRVLVQDPAEAFAPDMPAAAAEAVADWDPLLGSPADFAHHLDRWSSQPAAAAAGPPPEGLVRELAISSGQTPLEVSESLGAAAGYGCPTCGGPLFHVDDQPLRFRCHVGHAYTGRVLAALQQESVQQSLQIARRTLLERVRLLDRLQGGTGGELASQSTAERMREANQAVTEIERLLSLVAMERFTSSA